MIYDSIIWKDELKTKTEEFKKLLEETKFSTDWMNKEEADGETASYKLFFKFQKYCFYSAVITRKFLESNRLSDELVATSYLVKYFKRKSKKTLTKDNFESVEDEYNVETEFQKHLTLKTICNLFIHSFLFNPKLIEEKIDDLLSDEEIENWDIKGISGLYINSDLSKEKEVYFFPLKFITDIFEAVYTDKVIYYGKNNETGEEVRSRKNPSIITFLKLLGLKK